MSGKLPAIYYLAVKSNQSCLCTVESICFVKISFFSRGNRTLRAQLRIQYQNIAQLVPASALNAQKLLKKCRIHRILCHRVALGYRAYSLSPTPRTDFYPGYIYLQRSVKMKRRKITDFCSPIPKKT